MEQRFNRKVHHKSRIKNPNLLAKDEILLQSISTLFTIAVALSNTFVNVYLWKLEKDFLIIGWFNLFQYVGIMFTFMLAGRLAKGIDRIFLLRIGVGTLTVFYLVVLLLSKNAVEHYIFLGMLMGIGQGFYWFSYDLLYFEITGPENRDIFNGWNGLLTSIGGVIAPFVSGWFLSRKTGVTGYRIIFFISLTIFFIAVIVSFFFYKRKDKGKFHLKQVFGEALKKINWRYITLGMMAQGGREGVIIFLIGLLIYIATKNEFSLGSYTMTISAITSVTYYLVGKFIKRRWRYKSMMFGTIMMALSVIPLFVNINYTTLFIYGIGTSIFAPFYFIPLTSTIFDTIGQSDESAKLRGEYIVLRETGSNIGRILISFCFLFIVKFLGPEQLKYLLLVSGSLQILTWYFVKKVRNKKVTINE